MSESPRPRRATIAKSWIGQKFYWKTMINLGRGVFKIHLGVLEGVEGNNAKIDGDYHWIPYMRNFRLAVPEDTPLVRTVKP